MKFDLSSFVVGGLTGFLITIIIFKMITPSEEYFVAKAKHEILLDAAYGILADDPEPTRELTTYTMQSIYYINMDSLWIMGENEGIIQYFDNVDDMFEWWENFTVRLMYIEDVKQSVVAKGYCDDVLHLWAQGMYWDDIAFPLVQWTGLECLTDPQGVDHFENHYDTIGWIQPGDKSDVPPMYSDLTFIPNCK